MVDELFLAKICAGNAKPAEQRCFSFPGPDDDPQSYPQILWIICRRLPWLMASRLPHSLSIHSGCRLKTGLNTLAQSLHPRFVLPNLPTRAKVRAFQLSGVNHVFSIIQAAGWPIWPLLFASVIAVALIIERTAALRRSKIVPAGLLQSAVAEYRQSGISDAQLARLEGIRRWVGYLRPACAMQRSSREIMKEAIEEAGRGVAHELERFLTTWAPSPRLPR
jgi:hypothetical protein